MAHPWTNLHALEEGQTPNDAGCSATQISDPNDDEDKDEWVGWRERERIG
jgi:hypothetical protein